MSKEMTVFKKAKELIDYTFSMTENTDRYSKRRRFTFVDRMQNLSLDIYSDLLKANELSVKERIILQTNVVANVKILLFLIELSNKRGFIHDKQLFNWAKIGKDVLYLTTAWKNKTK